MRVLVADPSYSLEEARILLDGVAEVEPAEPPWSGDDVAGLLVGPDQLVRQAELEALPALQVVATCSVGFDHVDVEAATVRGVWVCNVPDYCVEEMADSSLALLLALLRGVVELDRSVRAGGWDHTAAGTLHRLAGTRLGIVGFGRIGRALAVRALALGLEVWASDPVLPPEEIEAVGVRPATLAELLRACRAISLHVPLTPATERMLGEAELRSLPRGAVLVDTARAALVDFDAVLAALEDGHLGGAAFDVLPTEPPTLDAPAPQAPNLIVNPHAAWYSPESEKAAYSRPILAVREVLEGRAPKDAVPT